MPLQGIPSLFGGRRGVGVPTTPDLSGLLVWVEARFEAYSNGADACTWHDQSGSGNNLTSSFPNCFTFATNSINTTLPSFRNGGGVLRANLPNIMSALTEASVQVLVKVDTDCTFNGFWDFSNSDFSQAYPYSDCIVYENWGATVRKVVGDPTPSLSNWNLYTVWSKASDWGAQFNNDAPFTSGSNTVSFNTTPLFGYSVSGAVLTGNIAGFVIYDHKISSTTMSTNAAYFNSIYGLP